MSEMERHIGKIRKVDLGNYTIEEWCEKKCKSIGIGLDECYKSYKEALLRIKREFPCLKTGDDSVFVYTFFWFSIYFLTVSSDICPTDSTK